MPREITRLFRLYLLLAGGLLAAPGECLASPYYSVTTLDGPGGDLQATLNNLGQIAGTWIQSSSGAQSPYFYNPAAGGQVTLLGVTSPSGQNPGGYSFQGSFSGINDSGQAIGYTFGMNPSSTMLYNSTTGQITTVPVNSGILTDSGPVYGNIAGGGRTWQPAVYQNGTVQAIGLPPGAASATVSAANSLGQVVVQATMQNGAQYQNFELSGGKWTALGTLTGAIINNQGAVAGVTLTLTNLLQPGRHLDPAGRLPIKLGVLPGDTLMPRME